MAILLAIRVMHNQFKGTTEMARTWGRIRFYILLTCSICGHGQDTRDAGNDELACDCSNGQATSARLLEAAQLVASIKDAHELQAICRNQNAEVARLKVNQTALSSRVTDLEEKVKNISRELQILSKLPMPQERPAKDDDLEISVRLKGASKVSSLHGSVHLRPVEGAQSRIDIGIGIDLQTRLAKLEANQHDQAFRNRQRTRKMRRMGREIQSLKEDLQRSLAEMKRIFATFSEKRTKSGSSQISPARYWNKAGARRFRIRGFSENRN